MALFDRLHTEPVYNTRAVVQRTGVPADTIRAWERRYRFPSPCRTEGNQRLYSERDVAIICWLRDQTRAGMTISHAVSMYRTLLSQAGIDESPASAPPRTAPAPARPAPDLTPSQQFEGDRLLVTRLQTEPRQSYFHICLELIGALSEYNTQRAEQILEELIAVSSAESVCHEVLQPAMIEIGRRWEIGALSTSAEHFASAFVQRKVSALFNLSRPDQGRGPILAACVEGEEHELGLLFTTLFLSRSGYQIVYLGCDLPAIDLVGAVTALKPPLVLLSAASHETIPSLDRTIRLLKEHGGRSSLNAVGAGPLIGYGGGIFNRQPEQRCRIDALFLGGDGRQAVEACDQLIGDQSVVAQR